MEFTPFTAFAPQMAPPGPQITSMRSMSIRNIQYVPGDTAKGGHVKGAAIHHHQ
jgi:hypothetical protein